MGSLKVTHTFEMYPRCIWEVNTSFRPFSHEFTRTPVKTCSREFSPKVVVEQGDSDTKMKAKEEVFESKHFLKNHVGEQPKIGMDIENSDLQATLGQGLILLRARFRRDETSDYRTTPIQCPPFPFLQD